MLREKLTAQKEAFSSFIFCQTNSPLRGEKTM